LLLEVLTILYNPAGGTSDSDVAHELRLETANLGKHTLLCDKE